jgi:undecaprenyl-diphosphatase
MLDQINQIDVHLFLFLNGLHSPFFDWIMWWISNIYTGIPIYLGLIFYFIRRYKWKGFYIILLMIFLICITDQGSVQLFKEVFHRLRPCNNPNLAGLVHIVRNHCGGQYGFVSSHASNMFGIAIFTAMMIKYRWYSIFIISWAVLVSYSRIYLGVHYPGDIIFGGLFGSISGYFIYKLINYLDINYFYFKHNVEK